MSEEKKLSWLGILIAAGATITAAIISIAPFIWGLVTGDQEKDQPLLNQNQSIAKTEIHIHAPPGSTVTPSSDQPVKDKRFPQKSLVRDETHIIEADSKPVNNSPEAAINPDDLKNTVVTTTPVRIPKIDISGVWRFDANIVRGKDASGTLFEHISNYNPIVEIAQTGNSITGNYSGPPAIICGSGSIKGSIKQDLVSTNVEWTLDCMSECAGEQRKFTGTFDVSSNTITGRYKPANRPTKKGCWLAYENLSGKLE